MTPDEFRDRAEHYWTADKLDPTLVTPVAAALGLAGECGEVVELVKKLAFHGKGFDNERMVEELGDVLFYWSILASHYGISLEEAMAYNVEKLRKRHG